MRATLGPDPLEGICQILGVAIGARHVMNMAFMFKSIRGIGALSDRGEGKHKPSNRYVLEVTFVIH